MLKLFNRKCLALHPLKNHLFRPGFIGAQFAAHSTAATKKNFYYMTPREKMRELGISWKSTCLPLSPEFSCIIDSNDDLRSKIESIWSSVEDPEYPDDVNQLVIPSSDISLSSLFGTGGYLVRNNGDRVDLDVLKNKYVFVCCFLVPPTLKSRSIINVCDELCSSRDDVEVVMAAWINDDVVDDDDYQKEVFDHFFSGFPKSCLAVPFEDSKRRANVCKLVTDYNPGKLRCSPCLVLDSKGMVLPPVYCSYYGAAAFPFTEEIEKDFKAKNKQLTKSGSLEQLLLIDGYSPDAVYRFNPEGDPREEVRISELNNKLVGLYVPGRSGDRFRTVLNIYEQCVKRQLELEIVVAYSESDSDLHDRKLYQERIDRLMLEKHDICRQWWCLPLNNSVSARLDRLIEGPLTEGYVGINGSNGDRLFMVGPGGGFIDVYAPCTVMKMYGVDAYPFTRDTIIQKDTSRMREITLDCVLSGDDVLFRGTDRDDVTSAEKLRGRKINLYFGCLYYMWDREKVFSSYHEAKAKDPGFEAVFIYLKNDSYRAELLDKTIHAMPWYVCTLDSDRIESVREKLGCGPTEHFIVGFGEDGRLNSCQRTQLVACQPAELAAFTVDDTLHEDMSKRRKDLPYPRPRERLWYGYD